jgi:hypothetical protein
MSLQTSSQYLAHCRSLSPVSGKSQCFKISCGCKDTPPAEHDSYKLEVLNGY